MNFKTTAAAAFFLMLLAPAVSGAATPKPLPNPDRPAVTPRAAAPSAGQGASISTSRICPTLRRFARMGNSSPGLRVTNLNSGKTVCSLNSTTKRSLASNTKIFTTSTALARLGEDHRFVTRVVADGKVNQKGVLRGSLYLIGSGDPSFGTGSFNDAYLAGEGPDIETLARKIKMAGIKQVTGRLWGDATIFDQLRGVADSGYGTSPYIGPLSGLAFNAGYTSASFSRFSNDPARLATRSLVRQLRKRGIKIRKETALGRAPRSARSNVVAKVRSEDMVWMARLTNLFSNNFYAETLLKDLGAFVRNSGTTNAGTKVVERYARSVGSDIDQADGSGLTVTNRATPADVVKMLTSNREKSFSRAFLKSLPEAGIDGTLADRMRGTAAQGNCHAKTGTLTGVSALSGYCFNSSGRKFVFSILMNGVSDLSRAHSGQDRIAARIAAL